MQHTHGDIKKKKKKKKNNMLNVVANDPMKTNNPVQTDNQTD